MSSDDVGLPKSAIAAAMTIIFLHWSGASFVEGNSASTWLGVVHIARGWMVGVFLHLWFIVAFLFYWQRIDAPSMGKLETKNQEIYSLQLVEYTRGFLQLLKEACAVAESGSDSPNEYSAESLVDKLSRRALQVKDGNGTKSIIPAVERYGFGRYRIDFSKAAFTFGSSSSAGSAETPRIEDLQCLEIPAVYRAAFFRAETKTTFTILTRNIGWYREFLPSLLGWFGLCSIILRAFGIL